MPGQRPREEVTFRYPGGGEAASFTGAGDLSMSEYDDAWNDLSDAERRDALYDYLIENIELGGDLPDDFGAQEVWELRGKQEMLDDKVAADEQVRRRMEQGASRGGGRVAEMRNQRLGSGLGAGLRRFTPQHGLEGLAASRAYALGANKAWEAIEGDPSNLEGVRRFQQAVGTGAGTEITNARAAQAIFNNIVGGANAIGETVASMGLGAAGMGDMAGGGGSGGINPDQLAQPAVNAAVDLAVAGRQADAARRMAEFSPSLVDIGSGRRSVPGLPAPRRRGRSNQAALGAAFQNVPGMGRQEEEDDEFAYMYGDIG